MAFVECPHPLGMIPLNEIRAKADLIFPDILRMATKWQPAQSAKVELKRPYPAEHIKFKGTYSALNKMLYDKKMSLGLPVIPPTPEAVAAMLKGTKHNPGEVVWVVPPRQAQLTVELVATLGAMSGCKPSHMPLLLAMVKALSQPDYDFRGNITTTAPTSPVIVINGPIVKKLGISHSTALLGQRQPVNIALGYFVDLLAYVVGGAAPPDVDKSTQGSRGDLVALVLGENEAENPWKESYAVEHGFKSTDNVVTAYGAYLGTNNTDHTSVKGKDLLNTLAAASAGTSAGISSCLTKYDQPFNWQNAVKFTFFFLGPEHAQTIARDFPTKRAAEEYLVKQTKLPMWGYAPTQCALPAGFGPWDENTMVQRFTTPEQIHVVVTGGPGKQSQVWPAFVTDMKPVHVVVED
ncbi:thiol-disulfide oxidoreductase [Oryzomonas sagensis]|uniref:Thiol-disulfide oxidoreductase n=3 Tax=Oryzomonas sagensis TaxID=2603857 RepID=A0ABQ6TKW8_9BACT|nr:thiol-disulfide oxidoreductase [Oryzomonas sagensis]